MPLNGYLGDLADACRKSGLKVVEVKGWTVRGHAPFTHVETIVCHHTAGPASGNMPSLEVVKSGRPGLTGPLCNLALGRDGTVYVVAAGVAYHAGAVSSKAYDNWHAIGIEAEATGTSAWPEVQMDAYARLCAALCAHYGIEVSRVLGHKEVASPRGRKVDPNFDCDVFRKRVIVAAHTRKEPQMTPALQFKADLLAACRKAKANVPAKRTAVHAIRATVQTLAAGIK